MTFYKTLFSILFAGIILSSCGNSGTESVKDKQKEEVTEAKTSLPTLSEEKLNSLKSSCDLIDFIFFDLPISMSQDNQGSIQQVLGFFDTDQVSHSDNCKAIARVFFNGTGESLLEADLFFTQGCMYFVFYSEGQPKWSNGINAAGQNFFQQIISSAQAAHKAQ